VVENNTQAGAGTGIFDDSLFWYLAVRLNDGSICAVTAIRVDRDESIDDFDKNLLLAMLAECSVVIEKERLNHKNAEYAFRMKQEHLRSNLLRSISHDLRTPLTTISGNASLLIEGTVKDEVERRRVYQDIYDDSVWLTGLVENLLSITKMDGGTLNMNMQAQDLGDIVDAAVAHAEPRLKQAIISVDKGKEISIVNGDSSLLVQLAVNLIDNAVKYAGENCHIHISLRNSNGQCRLSVADNGKGISDTDKKKIFDMFYTAQKNTTIDGRRGLGLGLSLCKSIAQAHGGTINVADAYPHGAIFTVSLPEMKGNII
jgi:two-component system sensor histidine kinase KdpD